MLTNGWHGSRITFGFMLCPLCKVSIFILQVCVLIKKRVYLWYRFKKNLLFLLRFSKWNLKVLRLFCSILLVTPTCVNIRPRCLSYIKKSSLKPWPVCNTTGCSIPVTSQTHRGNTSGTPPDLQWTNTLTTCVQDAKRYEAKMKCITIHTKHACTTYPNPKFMQATTFIIQFIPMWTSAVS